jgi:hypothetical protein
VIQARLREEKAAFFCINMSETKQSLFMVSKPPCKHRQAISIQLQQLTTKRPTTRTAHRRPREARHISTEKFKRIYNQIIHTKKAINTWNS